MMLTVSDQGEAKRLPDFPKDCPGGDQVLVTFIELVPGSRWRASAGLSAPWHACEGCPRDPQVKDSHSSMRVRERARAWGSDPAELPP